MYIVFVLLCFVLFDFTVVHCCMWCDMYHQNFLSFISWRWSNQDWNIEMLNLFGVSVILLWIKLFSGKSGFLNHIAYSFFLISQQYLIVLSLVIHCSISPLQKVICESSSTQNLNRFVTLKEYERGVLCCLTTS